MTKQLTNKIALITGASRGIGRAVAKRYAAEGAQVIALARTVSALESLDDEITADGGLQPALIALDLQDGDGIDALGAALYDKYGKLDILVGNAAMLGTLSPITHTEPKTWQQIIDVNLTANWRLLRSMHPLLKQSEAGRAMFVTSGAARTAFAYWGAYATSKAGLEMVVRTYAAENSKTNIKANLIDPSVVATTMRAQAFPGEDATTLSQPNEVTDLFVELALSSCEANGKLVIR